VVLSCQEDAIGIRLRDVIGVDICLKRQPAPPWPASRFGLY